MRDCEEGSKGTGREWGPRRVEGGGRGIGAAMPAIATTIAVAELELGSPIDSRGSAALVPRRLDKHVPPRCSPLCSPRSSPRPVTPAAQVPLHLLLLQRLLNEASTVCN